MIRHATIYNQTSTCSNSTIETLENGVKYAHENDVKDVILVSLLLSLNIFHNFV